MSGLRPHARAPPKKSVRALVQIVEEPGFAARVAVVAADVPLVAERFGVGWMIIVEQ